MWHDSTVMTTVADDLSDLPNGWFVENVLDDAAPLGARGPIGSPDVLTIEMRVAAGVQACVMTAEWRRYARANPRGRRGGRGAAVLSGTRPFRSLSTTASSGDGVYERDRFEHFAAPLPALRETHIPPGDRD